ncbi:MAG: DUF2213 domain-containing protein, partial [Sulfurimonas sp.]
WRNRNDSMDKKLRIDSGRIDSYEYDEDEDTLTADVELTRSQVLPYRDDNGEIVRELLPPDELSDTTWLDSTKGKPVTDDHPSDPLNIDSLSEHSKGTLHDKPSVKELDSEQISVWNKVTIFNDKLIEAIQGGKEQVSIGRKVDIYDEPGEYRGDQYDRVQKNFRLNHLAVVDRGRAGPEVKLRMDGDMVQAKEDAEWTTAYVNDLPDSSFAIIEPAYENGDTENKNARHLPHHGPGGGGTKDVNLDLSHLRNAFARVSQIKPITDSISTSELRNQAESHLENHRDALETEQDSGENISLKNINNESDNMKLTIGDKELDLEPKNDDQEDIINDAQDKVDELMHRIKDLEDEDTEEDDDKLTQDEVQELLEDKEEDILDAIDAKVEVIHETKNIDDEYEPEYDKSLIELKKDFIEKVADVSLENKSDGYVEVKYENLLDSVKEQNSKPVGDNRMVADASHQRESLQDKREKATNPEFLGRK